MSIGRSRAWIMLVLAAFGLRLVAVLATRDYLPGHDDLAYLRHALALVDTHAYPVYHAGHHVVPTAYRPPGWPIALALVHRVFGAELVTTDLMALRVVQAIIGAAVAGLIGIVATQIWGRRTGLVATAIAAASPVLVIFGASLISEPLFLALELGAIACALHARGRLPWALAAGVLAGLAALTRVEGLVLLIGVALCLGTRRTALVAVVAALACVAPWTVRNAITLHHFVPVSTESGNTLAGMYNPLSLGDERWHDPRLSGLYGPERRAHRYDEAALDSALMHAAVRFAADHPTYPLRVAVVNAGRLSGVAPTSFSRLSLSTVSLPTSPAWLVRVGLLLTTLLALAGATRAAARRAPAGWWVIGGVIAVAALLVNAEQRFALPLQAWLAPLGALLFTRGE